MRPPNERRNFVHKRIIGAAGGFLSGGFAGAAGGFLTSGRRKGGQPAIRTERVFGNQGPCAAGKVRAPDGHCHGRGALGLLHPGAAFAQGALPGGKPFTDAVGAAVMGQYGAALTPFVEGRQVRTCLPGMVLGKDGLCYNRRDIANKEREYPRGTRPLGTPGEMAALQKAAAFGRRMETTVKRMQKIGVLKKPKAGARRAPARPRQLMPGGTSIVNVE